MNNQQLQAGIQRERYERSSTEGKQESRKGSQEAEKEQLNRKRRLQKTEKQGRGSPGKTIMQKSSKGQPPWKGVEWRGEEERSHLENH